MESLQRAISILGGQSLLAGSLGVVQSAVAGWMKRGTVPVKYCPAIERATHGQVTRQHLRPDDWQDIWPELADSEQKQPSALAQQARGAINSEVQEGAHV
jgi:DNA-binding transcriptional regulator YdaS (Cro superfamily)